MRLHIAGSNSALPAFGRHPSAFLLDIDSEYILIDCGEGTQFQLKKFKWPSQKISHIFISHLHGDHVFGLPGLLTSFSLGGRIQPLDIYGPPGIKKFILNILTATFGYIKFDLNIHELEVEKTQKILETNKFIVTSFTLDHTVPCIGYLFEEQPARPNIHKEIIIKYKLEPAQIKQLLAGQNVLINNEWIKAENAIYQKKTPSSFAYCSDTRLVLDNADLLEGVTMLYHEATYTKDMKEKALERGHSTSSDAAMMAQKANVEHLLIGHISSKYPDPEILVGEARQEFPNTSFALEGQIIEF